MMKLPRQRSFPAARSVPAKIHEVSIIRGFCTFALLLAAELPAALSGAEGPPSFHVKTSSLGQLGQIQGRVINPDTGEYIGNAEIRVEGSSTVENSRQDGSYQIRNLPEGAYTVVVSYTGYASSSASLVVKSGFTTIQNIELSGLTKGKDDRLYKMEAYTVATSREGQAKAIMEQRAAMTATNVVAADAFGSLEEGNAAELLQYLPGVEMNPSGIVSASVSIRGMSPEYSGLTIDGMAAETSITGSRAVAYGRTNLGAIDLVELNKTISADMDASSPAGTVNLKSKTAFQRSGRFVAWQLYATATSSEFNLRKTYGQLNSRARKVLPGGTLEYSDTYLGGKLGLVATLGSTSTYSPQNTIGVTYDKSPTNASPTPILPTQIRFHDQTTFRAIRSGALSLDYKVSDRLVLSMRGQLQLTEHNIYGRTVNVISTRAALAARSNSTEMISPASPTGGNNPRMTFTTALTPQDISAINLRPSITYTAGSLEFDAGFAYSLVSYRYIPNLPDDASGTGPVRSITETLFPIGWTAVRSGPGSSNWTFAQTSGRDYHLVENRAPSAATNSVVRGILDRDRARYMGQMNLKYSGSWALPTFFKAGVKSDELVYKIDQSSYSYTYLGEAGDRSKAIFPVSGSIIDLDPSEYGTLASTAIRFPDLTGVAGLLKERPSQFLPAATNATNATNLYPKRYVRERIDSAYVMGNVRYSKWVLQGGARMEETRHVFRVYERGRPEKRSGKYDNVFASASAKYRIKPDLVATLGFSQSVKRPSYDNLTGVATVNEELLTGTIPNPELKPEFGKNYSANIAYYFEPAGNLAVSVFRSEVNDLQYQVSSVPSEEIGLGKDYPGYEFTTWSNRAASFRIQGIEIEYRQQLIFLPGLLKGTGVFLNYTRTRNTDPDYQLNIAPAVASAGVNYRYGRLNCNFRSSWTHEKLVSNTGYGKARTMLSGSLNYRIKKATSIFINGRNLLSTSLKQYDRQFPDNIASDTSLGIHWTMGLSGTF